MALIVKEIVDHSTWESFVLKQTYTPFVQSAKYGSFYEDLGEKSWIFGIYDNDKLIGGSLVTSVHAKRGNFLYLPYGPLLPEEGSEALLALTQYIKNFAKKHEYHFIRVSPYMLDTPEIQRLFKRAGYRPAPMHMLAEQTILLDVRQNEEDLMMEMNKNHRNLIRRCEKKGVTIRLSQDQAALDRFNDMHDATARRHGFARFSREYIEKEFHVFAKDNQALIFESYLPNGELDASSIIMFYGNMSAYRHSASLGKDKKLPTSYAIQWEVIKETKRRNMAWYNFWGVAPEDADKSHPFYGITHFKKGFGGERKNLLHCQDYPVRSFYWVNWIIETIRRKKRGF